MESLFESPIDDPQAPSPPFGASGCPVGFSFPLGGHVLSNCIGDSINPRIPQVGIGVKRHGRAWPAPASVPERLGRPCRLV